MVRYEIRLYNPEIIDTYIDYLVLWDSQNPDLNPIISGNLEMEIGKASKLELVIPRTNTNASTIRTYVTRIGVRRSYIANGIVIDHDDSFFGPVVSIEEDMTGNYTVVCEDIFSLLNAVYIIPYWLCDYVNDSDTVEDKIKTIINRIWISFDEAILGDTSDDRALYRNIIFSVGEVYIKSDVDFTKSDIREKFKERDYVTISEFISAMEEILGGYFIVTHFIHSAFVENKINYYNYADNYGIPETAELASSFSDDSIIFDGDSGVYPEVRSDRIVIPLFEFGSNLLDYSSEPSVSIENMYSGLCPVGKDGLTIQNQRASIPGTIWYNDLVTLYGFRVKKLNFDDATTEVELRDKADKYYNRMLKVRNLKRYHITGLESIEYGRGLTLVKLMHNARIIVAEKDIRSTNPVLSLKLDLLNPLVVEFVIGPYIPENYLDESIIK